MEAQTGTAIPTTLDEVNIISSMHCMIESSKWDQKLEIIHATANVTVKPATDIRSWQAHELKIEDGLRMQRTPYSFLRSVDKNSPLSENFIYCLSRCILHATHRRSPGLYSYGSEKGSVEAIDHFSLKHLNQGIRSTMRNQAASHNASSPSVSKCFVPYPFNLRHHRRSHLS